ncbi:MAG: murein biosynthesis integral membrane protein MurJ, partial [Clostridiales bacterium]|nr:murein biosynthesis integral membrane protein MurJ [Clostridiales bacterium]
MDNNRTAKSVGLVMLLSTLARGLSLVGSILYTSWFGYTLETDIYSYAVNLPNLVFTCLGSALVTVVIPIYAGRLAAGERGRARDFINNILSISLILAAAVALLGIFISPLITGLVGRFDADGARGLALFALRLMFPVMIFHAVNYVLQGVLQSNGRFVLPAIVSAFSGLSVILYVTLLAGRFGIRGLLVATFFGLALQAVVLVPPVAARRGGLGYRFRPSLNLADGDVRLAGRLALPVLVSSSSYQLNMFVNSTFAAGFDGGVITIANMQTLAFTAAQLFILSTLAVYFPKMAALHATGDDGGFRGAFDAVLRLILYFAVPASVGLAFLSG